MPTSSKLENSSAPNGQAMQLEPDFHDAESHQSINSQAANDGIESVTPSTLESSAVSVSHESRDLKDRVKIFLGLKSRQSPVVRWGRKTLEPRIKPLFEYPHGYSKLAAFRETDPNFMIFRKHAWLRNRLLDHYQDKLAEYEEDMENLDKWDLEQDPRRLMSRRLDVDPDGMSRREELIEKIEKTMKTYDELLLRTQQISAIRQPTRRDQQSVYNFIHNTKAQVALEAEWIQFRDDLVAISSAKEISWLNGFLQSLFRKISKNLTMFLFQTEEQRWKTDDEEIMLVSSQRFNYVIHICITVLATALLLIPVSLLSEAESLQSSTLRQVLLIFVFTLLFAFCCGVFTNARRQEIFAASAAYCAVLVVFLGNSNNHSRVMVVFQNGTVVASET